MRYFKKNILKHRLLLPYTLAKNIIKKIVNKLFDKNYLMQNLWDIHEIPVSALSIEVYLNKRGVTFKKFSINQIEKGIQEAFIDNGRFNSKVVYDCEVK